MTLEEPWVVFDVNLCSTPRCRRLMGGAVMKRCFTLEYWIDDSWYVGKLKEVPGVFSQGESLEELEENIRDVYQLMTEEDLSIDRPGLQTKEITVDVMWNEGILLGSWLVWVATWSAMARIMIFMLIQRMGSKPLCPDTQKSKKAFVTLSESN